MLTVKIGILSTTGEWNERGADRSDGLRQVRPY